MTVEQDLACPRCRALVPPITVSTGPMLVCPSCGHRMSSALLVEQASLDRWHTWAGQRLAWVNDRLLAGDLLAAPNMPSQPAVVGRQSAPASGAPRSTGGAGALLLVAGAFLLVVAGIAFVAFAWDALGPIGQIVTLFAIGTLSLLASVPVARRLPGTATAIGTVGVLIIAIATLALRFEGDDIVSAPASLGWALLAGVALAGWGVRAAGDLKAVGELAAVVGVCLALALLAFAPSNDAVPIDEPWAWWVAATLCVGSLALLLSARWLGVRSWPPLAVVTLGLAAIALAVFVDDTSSPTQSGLEPLISAIVLFGCGIAVLALYAVIRQYRIHLMLLASGLGGLSLSLAWAAGSTPSVRPLAALILIALGLTCIGVNAAMSALGVPLSDNRSPLLYRTLVLVGSVTIGTAVGLLVAPWVNFPTSSDPNSATAWVQQAWPAWRGLLAGLAFALLLAVCSFIAARVAARSADTRPDWTGVFELAALLSALSAWLITAFNDPASGRYVVPSTVWDEVLDQVERGVGVGLFLAGLALLVFVLLRRLPVWHVWLGAFALLVSALLIVDPDDVSASLEPELYSLLLAAPAAAAGLIWWWQHRPERSSSWITMAPATTLALLPPILSLLDDATARWWQSADPGSEYQIRLAAILGVGALLSIFGARWHLAGLLFPGLLAVLAVTTIQLIELGRFLPQWVSFAVTGSLLLAAGARWESVRRLGSQGSAWARDLR